MGVRHPVTSGLRLKGFSRAGPTVKKRVCFPPDGGTGMSKASPGLHEHGITSPVLCRSEESIQQGQKKELKEKGITGLRVSRSQGYAMLQFCTFHQKSPNQLASLDPHFPERKKPDPLLSKSCWASSPVRGTKLADNSLALALVSQGCYKLFQFVAALLRAVTMVGNCRHAASFSLACLYSLLCVT